MRRLGAAFAGSALLAAADPALAHVIIEGFPGWQGGLLHPLLVPSHALALAGLALLAGRQPGSERTKLVAAFPIAFAAAVFLVTRAVSSNNAELFVLAAGSASGLLVAVGRVPPPIPVAAILAAGGMAIAFDSVPALNSVAETLAALLATGLSASAVLTLVAWATGRLRAGWQLIGIRIVGSWIAASTILVLALRLAR